MLKKILVAMDDSVASQWAFETALELAQALQAELLMVHALDVFASSSPQHPDMLSNSTSPEVSGMVKKEYEQKWGELVKRYDTFLQQKQTEAEATGVSARYVQPYGRPGPAICHVASAQDSDLIVVGNRDHTHLQELVLGSVSHYILHHAPCSVTVIHTGQRRQATAQSQNAGNHQQKQTDLTPASHV